MNPLWNDALFLKEALPYNFCPMSNLPFWMKLIEKMAVQQLQRTLDDPILVGFRLGYGIQAALMEVLDDLWKGQDRACPFILALLDLLIAFHIINHSILLNWFWGLRMDGTILCWFFPFLHGRYQLVIERRDSFFVGFHRVWCSLLSSSTFTFIWSHGHWDIPLPWSADSTVCRWNPIIYFCPWWIKWCCWYLS